MAGIPRLCRMCALAALLVMAWHAPALPAEWSAITAADVLYTDNVFAFSAARRLQLSEDPSQPTVVSLSRPSDVVWGPSIDVRRTSSSSLGLTELSVKAHGFIFTNNPIFNHGDYRIHVNQQVAPDTFVLLRYRYVPNLFLGPNVDRQTGSQLPEEERVTSHTWRTQVDHSLSERWTATLVGRYGIRLYNKAFSERDTMFYTVGPRLMFRATSWVTLTLDYLYERGFADGANEPQFKDDISYRQHFVSAGTLFQLTGPFSLALIYAYREKRFTTDITGDPLNGARDHLHQGTVEVYYDVSPSARITLGSQRDPGHTGLPEQQRLARPAVPVLTTLFCRVLMPLSRGSTGHALDQDLTIRVLSRLHIQEFLLLKFGDLQDSAFVTSRVPSHWMKGHREGIMRYVFAPNQIMSRIEWCRLQQHLTSTTREEREGWWAEESGLIDALLDRDRVAFMKQSHPSQFMRYHAGLEDGQAILCLQRYNSHWHDPYGGAGSGVTKTPAWVDGRPSQAPPPSHPEQRP